MKALALYQTTIGKKAVMAVTGVVLYGFVIAHMLGNLQVYLGPEVFNDYAAGLKANAALLWSVRVTLLVSVVAHIVAATQLVVRTASARPVGYKKTKRLSTGVAALTMKYGGLFLFFFILFHLAHFTYPGIAMSKAYLHDPVDAYSNFVNAFRIPWVSGIYIVAQIFLGLHLYHGSWSLFQTLGFDPRSEDRRRFLAQTIGVMVAAGNLSFPIAVLAKVVT
jgi:succinate dehydrogenase / fumarate reductase, cytochrome b subunit